VGVYSLATGMMVHEFSVTRCSSAAGIAAIHTLPNALSGGTLVLVPTAPLGTPFHVCLAL